MADPVTIFELFAGSGMLGESVCAVLERAGYEPRILGLVERDAAAANLLLDRMEDATLERAPVYAGCLSGVDARPLAGWVDVLVASPPCQPYSSAGKRRGNSDDRSYGSDGRGPLWHTARIIAECRPALVFFENVPQWFTDGHFREFGEQLCRVGYDFAPPLFVAAEDVGAPHERERVYCLGWLADARRGGGEFGRDSGIVRGAAGEEQGEARQWERHGHTGRDAGPAVRPVADAESAGRGRHVAQREPDRRTTAGRRSGEELAERASGGLGAGGESSARDGQPERRGQELANRERVGRQEHERRQGTGGQSDAPDRCEDLGDAECAESRTGTAGVESGARIGRRGCADTGREFRRPMFPPGRNDYRRWAELVALGLDPSEMPAIESGVSVVADGMAASDLLRIGGNGIVPLAAALAFYELARAVPGGIESRLGLS